MKIKWIYLLFCFPVLILLAGDNEKEKIKSFDLDNFQESTNTKDLLLEEKNKDSDSSSFDLISFDKVDIIRELFPSVVGIK